MVDGGLGLGFGFGWVGIIRFIHLLSALEKTDHADPLQRSPQGQSKSRFLLACSMTILRMLTLFAFTVQPVLCLQLLSLT